MISQSELQYLNGVDVYARDGSKIGSAGQVYLDNQTGEPEWVSVRTGMFGAKESFVPLDQATLSDNRLEIPFDKNRVKGAPQIDVDGDLDPADEDELYNYYGLSGQHETSNDIGGDLSGPGSDNTTSGHDTSGTAMTRSEEHLVAGTRTEQSGKVRLRKYVVTEQQSVTVPVTHEEVRLEREPITGGEVMDGPAISEEDQEITLHAERPVVTTESVPVERVRLSKETVTEQETVGGEVRKEQIEFSGDTDAASDKRRG